MAGVPSICRRKSITGPSKEMSDEFIFSPYLSSGKQTRRHLHLKLCTLVEEIESYEKRSKRILTVDIQRNLNEIEVRMEKRGFKVFDGGLSDEIIHMTDFLAKLLKEDEDKEMVIADNAKVTLCYWFLVLMVICIIIITVRKFGW